MTGGVDFYLLEDSEIDAARRFALPTLHKSDRKQDDRAYPVDDGAQKDLDQLLCGLSRNATSSTDNSP